MYSLDKISWEILNATADDCENLEQIYRQLCFEPIGASESPDKAVYDYRPVSRAPLLSEVADRLSNLVKQGLLTIVMDEKGHPWQNHDDLSYVWRGWFSMTPEGKSAWESSEYLAEQE